MDTDHTNGTYICLYPSKKSVIKIESFCKQMMIKEPVAGSNLHVTVVSSKNPMPLTQSHKLKKSIIAEAVDLDVWPDVDNKSLVIKLVSKELMTLYKFYEEHYNADSDHPEYSPHVTISYNYQGEPLNFDLFHRLVNDIQFDRMNVMPRDV